MFLWFWKAQIGSLCCGQWLVHWALFFQHCFYDFIKKKASERTHFGGWAIVDKKSFERSRKQRSMHNATRSVSNRVRICTLYVCSKWNLLSKPLCKFYILLSALCIPNFIEYDVEHASEQTEWELLEFLSSDMNFCVCAKSYCPEMPHGKWEYSSSPTSQSVVGSYQYQRASLNSITMIRVNVLIYI